MIKKLIGAVLTVAIMTTNSHALTKENSYDLINQCKYEVDKSGKYNSTLWGIIIGMSQAYKWTLQMNGIDNDYASLSPDDFGKQMCKLTLAYRKSKNEETGGKYDVTQFYGDLINTGYIMTLPPRNDTNTTN